MKRLKFVMLAMLTSGAAYALPVGNPSEASLLCDGLFFEGNCCDNGVDYCDPCGIDWCNAFSFRFGFYGDYVFNRYMEVADAPHQDIEDFEIFTNAGYLALNFFDRVDLFSSLGVSSAQMQYNGGIAAAAITNLNFNIYTASNFSWSVGGRATLWECGCTSLGIEGQYFRFSPNIRKINFAGGQANTYPDDFLFARYSEWQVGVGISHRINILVPYVAVKWARSHLDFSASAITLGGLPVQIRNLESKKRWGFATGVSLVDCERAAVTVEGRFGDEKALYVNGQIRF